MDNPEQATGDMKRELLYAWAAGFIDGDGSISIMANNVDTPRPGFRLGLMATGIDRKPLDRLVGLFGGGVMGPYSERETYGYIVHASNARAALKRMLPYFVNKRDQAELAIRFQNNIELWGKWRRGGVKRNRLPDHVFAQRAEMQASLKAMHIRRGRQPAVATTDSGEPAVAGK